MDNRHSIQDWEAAIDNMDGVNLVEIYIRKKFVTGARGTVCIGDEVKHISWISDGKCFDQEGRVSKYDVEFEETK